MLLESPGPLTQDGPLRHAPAPCIHRPSLSLRCTSQRIHHLKTCSPLKQTAAGSPRGCVGHWLNPAGPRARHTFLGLNSTFQQPTSLALNLLNRKMVKPI